ncbi:MAG: hypothetical protein EU981_01710 [Candidatus Liberibacter ctenarytainae]|uniref:Uncharacterized protein n=1 Tax=Candidatus Liberibacter ctenarytainae TaxID=2020335 RepID=A0A937AJW2_9HYPH|nr:hypothetical protein [Candidatus Liberibacter ctenarytainae]
MNIVEINNHEALIPQGKNKIYNSNVLDTKALKENSTQIIPPTETKEPIHSIRKTDKAISIAKEVALSSIPIYGTIQSFKRGEIGWGIFGIATDILLFIPVVGCGAKLAGAAGRLVVTAMRGGRTLIKDGATVSRTLETGSRTFHTLATIENRIESGDKILAMHTPMKNKFVTTAIRNPPQDNANALVHEKKEVDQPSYKKPLLDPLEGTSTNIIHKNAPEDIAILEFTHTNTKSSIPLPKPNKSILPKPNKSINTKITTATKNFITKSTNALDPRSDLLHKGSNYIYKQGKSLVKKGLLKIEQQKEWKNIPLEHNSFTTIRLGKGLVDLPSKQLDQRFISGLPISKYIIDGKALVNKTPQEKLDKFIKMFPKNDFKTLQLISIYANNSIFSSALSEILIQIPELQRFISENHKTTYTISRLDNRLIKLSAVYERDLKLSHKKDSMENIANRKKDFKRCGIKVDAILSPEKEADMHYSYYLS